MNKPRPLVDERSMALAEHFLDSEAHTDDDRWDLADTIQKAVEDWFEIRERARDEDNQVDENYDPYEAIGESRFGLPGGGRSL